MHETYGNGVVIMKSIQMTGVVCNQCNKEIIGDYLRVKKEWGYFSDKDTQIHEFALCEKCYDMLVSTFITAPVVEFKKEVI